MRLGHWIAVGDHPFVAWPVNDSQTYDQWGQEIAAGDWVGSGTFFQAPLYPYFLALVYRVFGHHLSLVYWIQILFSIAGCYALYRAGRRMAGETVGLVAAALAAVYPVFIFYDLQLMKESFAVTLVCFLLWSLAEGRRSGSGGASAYPWAVAGALCGLIALLRENMLLVSPLLLLTIPGLRRHPRQAAFKAALFIGALVAILLPVTLRNGLSSGSYLPTTFQGGVNLYIGNNAQADGTYRPLVPGKQVPFYENLESTRLAEQAAGRTLSGSEVSSFWVKRVLEWARQNPAAFARLQMRKLALYWSWYELPDSVDFYYLQSLSPVLRLPWPEFGAISLLAVLGLWLGRKELSPFFPSLLFALAWMGATVVFFVFSRYRLPALPAMILLAALPIASALESFRQGSRRKALGWACVILACIAMPRLGAHEARMDLVSYNLARLHDERGHLEEARKLYLQTLHHDPESFLACLNLGRMAARSQQWQEAEAWLRRAISLEPKAEDAWSNLGGLYLATGRIQQAAEALDKSLALNPSHRFALHNRALVGLRQGDLPLAQTLNDRSLVLDPSSEPALRLRERLRSATTLQPGAEAANQEAQGKP